MKLTNIKSHKRNAGMTLLELTVVILVLLSLISILFVGARAWKKGSDRAGCIVNIRNVQQACRGFENMNPGAVVASTDIFGADKYLKFLKCPESSTAASATALVGYTFTTPAAPGTAGNIALECTVNATEHVPDGDIAQW
ncbi:MAG: hypothetical protein V4640_00140 [Verrucomicrobiota bacterium]